MTGSHSVALVASSVCVRMGCLASSLAQTQTDESLALSLAETKHTTPDWITLPRVLVAHSLSFLTGADRQHASLVCKVWSVVEKDKGAWPNNICVKKLSLEGLILVAPRLKLNRFDKL